MVFKMLILLGFFTVQEGLFIHSDIHRSIVNRVDYSVQIAANRTVAPASRFARFALVLCAECAKMCAPNIRFTTD
jgi:hypothetical protein